MTIISVNYTSPWYRLTTYEIPADLPPCPEGGCICTWNWVHLAGHGEGDGEEIVSWLCLPQATEVNYLSSSCDTGSALDAPKTFKQAADLVPCYAASQRPSKGLEGGTIADWTAV